MCSVTRCLLGMLTKRQERTGTFGIRRFVVANQPTSPIFEKNGDVPRILTKTIGDKRVETQHLLIDLHWSYLGGSSMNDGVAASTGFIRNAHMTYHWCPIETMCVDQRSTYINVLWCPIEIECVDQRSTYKRACEMNFTLRYFIVNPR